MTAEPGAASRIARLESLQIEHLRLVGGTQRSGAPENVLFVVSSKHVSDGRGDLFVALGLARQLDALGWGVAFLAAGGQDRAGSYPETTVVLHMLQNDAVDWLSNGVIHIGWVRNWTRDWAESSNLPNYDGVLGSSAKATNFLAARFNGPTDTMPIAVDTDIFNDKKLTRDLPVSTTVNNWGHARGLISALSTISSAHKISWFGHGLDSLEQVGEGVVIRGNIDYLATAEVYARSEIVLDDLTPSTREFGSQNSRLFEALAAGALVVTNCKEGLLELGLDGLPVVDEGEDLALVLDNLISNEGTIAQLSERFRSVVLDKHTYVRRAETFVSFVRRVRELGHFKRELLSLEAEVELVNSEKALLLEAVSAAEAEIELVNSEKALLLEAVSAAEAETELVNSEKTLLLEAVSAAEAETAQYRQRRAVRFADAASRLLNGPHAPTD